MFENRYPLLEVVQAIEELRESRGTTNKEICDFVRQQGRNPNDPMKILKTIRTLNKLVEEGVLIKKGKRYVFPSKPPELADNADAEADEDDCEEDEGDDDEGASKDGGDGEECGGDEEERNEEVKQEEVKQEEVKQEEVQQEEVKQEEEKQEEEKPEEEEEEEEDDDDDDDDDDDEEEEDDDDDDDDDGEGCEENEQNAEVEQKAAPPMDKTASKGLSKNRSLLGGPKTQDNSGAKEERSNNVVSKTSENIVSKKNTLKSVRKTGKGQNCEAKNNGKSKGGEAIAFCARDFIDSQYSQNSTQAKPVTLQKKPQDDLIKIENYETESVARAFGLRRRESKSRKHRGGDDCRSRSPIRGQIKNNNFFTDMKLDHSDNLRKNMISSQIFQEMTDTPMDIDRDNEVVDLDFDIMGHRSPIGPTSPINPGVHLDRTESCCSQQNNTCPENIKTEPDFECKTQFFLKKNNDYEHSRHSMARAIDMQSKRLAVEKEKLKRDIRSEDGNVAKTEKRASLCSVCEKKKRNS